MPFTPSGAGTPFIYPTQVSGSSGIVPLFRTAPGSVNPPIIFEPMSVLSGNQPLIWIVVTGQAQNWNGCEIYSSVDGTSYIPIGLVSRGQTQGSLTSALALGSDPDTADTFGVDVSLSRGKIVAATQTDADDFLSVAYVGGELIAYTAATLTAPFMYSFGNYAPLGTPYLRRGLYNTKIASHLIGTPFAILTESVFSHKYPIQLIGKTVYFKFVSFNTLGGQIQSIDNVTAYPYVITGVGVTPTPGGLADCAVDIGLSAGCSEDWGFTEPVVSSTCDWGVTGAAVTLQIDLGITGYG